MKRRSFLKGTGTAALGVTAGCSSVRNQVGAPEMEWEYEWEGFIGSGFNPAIIITGEIENVGDGYAEEFDIECQLLADDGSIIDSRRRTLRAIEPNEEQLFYYKFRPSRGDAEAFEEAEIIGEFPE